MDAELKKRLKSDVDGLMTYEYMANHIGDCEQIIDELVDNMVEVDHTGQFSASAARYLFAIDPEEYGAQIDRLVSAAIDKDRERRYIGDLLNTMWGEDYENRATELAQSNNNFRRIYKRLHQHSAL